MTPFGVQKFRRLVLAGSFSVITEFLMGFLGGILSGHWLGGDALAGVSLLSPVFTTVIFISSLFGVGMGVNYAVEMGRCEKRRAHEIFTQGFWSVLAVGIAFALALVLFGDRYLAYMGATPEVAAHARAYLNWFVPVAVLEPLAVFFLNCCYADGDDRQCYVVYALQLVVNIALAFVALASDWGTAGCALGATAGYAAAVVVLAFHFRKVSNSFRLVRHFSWADARRIVKSSFGDASGTLCDAILFFFLGKYFVAHFGCGELPVLGVVLTVLGLLEFFNGVGVAVQPIVSVYMGERNHLAARRVMEAALKLSVCEGAVASLVLLVWPAGAVRLVGIDDPSLFEPACAAVRLLVPGIMLTAVANLMNGYYILVGHEALAVVLSFVKWLIVPILFVLAMGWVGTVGVWLALGLSPVAATGLFVAYLLVRHGRAAFPWLLDRSRDAKVRLFDLPLEDCAIVEAAHAVGRTMREDGRDASQVMRAELMTEEVLMAVKDRNAGRRVLAEVTLDLNDAPVLTLRDDGEIFDITDVDAKVRSLRTFLVASVMERQRAKVNLVTTGFNRNVFRF